VRERESARASKREKSIREREREACTEGEREKERGEVERQLEIERN